MSLSRLSAALTAKHPKWSIIRSNFVASLDVGLFSARQLIGFAKRFDCLQRLRDYNSSSRDGSADIQEMWEEYIRKNRFSGPGNIVSEKRVRALHEIFPCAYLNAVSLAGSKVYRVISHTNWFELLGSANEFWQRDAVADLDLPGVYSHLSPDRLRSWCGSIGSLPEEKRWFRLDPESNKSLALGVVWFTDEDTVPFEWNEPASRRLAEAARDAHGLGHFPSLTTPGPTHLFALRFDGIAVDRVEHYRPSAIDGLDNARFMVPRNHLAGGDEVSWGRTAHLARIEDDSLRLNGARERIANQIWEEDLQGDRIEFKYLGELTTPHDVPDETFARRLEIL